VFQRLTLKPAVQVPASPSRALLVYAVAALLAGLATLALLSPVFGAPRPMVHIAWQHEVQSPDREAAEARFSLSEPHALGPGEFAYVVGDTTPVTLMALIADPAVVATDGIDRRTGTITASAPLTARRGGLVTAPLAARGAKAGGVLLLMLAAALAVISVNLTGPRASRAHEWWKRCRRAPGQVLADAGALGPAWLQRGIPVASTAAAGIFRIVFVSCTVAVAALEPASQRALSASDAAALAGPYGAVVRAMAAHPSLLPLVDVALWVSGALAVIGLATRVTFAAFVASFILWACAFTMRTTLHTVSALQLALLCLLAAPWGDACSVDAWLRRRRTGVMPDSTPGRRHGYAMWVPGFVLGLAYFAAAWAKIGHGPAWVLNGTARQHFLTDLDQAWTSWGPALTAHPAMATALSAAAIAVEALAVSAAFVPSWRYRLVIGGTVLSLLTGFALFQGIVWVGWWVLLLGFLPWSLIDQARPGGHRPTFGAGRAISRPQTGAIVALLLAQLGASIVMRDFRPFISGYDMYATTHGPEVDNVRGLERVRVVAPARDGWGDVPGCTFDAPAEGKSAAAADRHGALAAHLRTCLDSDPDVDTIRLDLDRQTYDWSSHTLQWRRRVDVAGPFARGELPDTWPFGH